MGKSQRVLSGSRTKGSTASPSGSIIYSYQGIYADTNASYFGSLLPRIGSGNRIKLYKGSKPLPDNQYDDSLQITKDPAELRGGILSTGSTDPLTTRIGFDLERMTFGQAPSIQKGEPFADISGFDPVSYLQDPGHTLWPANLWNVGSLPDHEFDGVIEVFDIRTEILGQLDLRYEGRAPRGALVGSFSENPFGSYEISDTWKRSDHPISPFFDGPNEMSRDKVRDVPVLARMNYHESQLYPAPTGSTSWSDPNSIVPAPGYLGLVDETTYPLVDRDYHRLLYSKIYKGNPTVTPPRGYYDLNERFVVSPGVVYNSGKNLIFWMKLSDASKIPITATDATYTNVLNSAQRTAPAFTGSFPGENDNPPLTSTYTPSEYIQKRSTFFYGSTNNNCIAMTGDAAVSFNDFIGGSPQSDAFDSRNSTQGTLKSYTICFWIRQDQGTAPASTRGQILLIGYDSGTYRRPGIAIEIESDGMVKHTRNGEGHNSSEMKEVSKSAINTAKADTWVHITVAFDASLYEEVETGYSAQPLAAKNYCSKLFVNGVPTAWASQEWDGPLLSSDGVNGSLSYGANLPDFGMIGADTFPPWGPGPIHVPVNDYRGQLADMAIWDKVLDADDVKAVYLAASGSITNTPGTREDPIIPALQLLNSGSCGATTNPLEERANHGFYFGKKAGSIVYGDW